MVYSYNLERVLTGNSYTLSLSKYTPVSTYAIIGDDTRRDYNNSGVVKLEMGGNALGTGFVVGDHTIATAAHCIYNENTGTYAQNMRVSLYNNSGTFVKQLDKTNTTIQAHIPDNYVTIGDDNYQYDYALITVSEDLSDYEHFELGELLDSAVGSTMPINVCGYSEGTLKIGEGSILNVYERHFEYDTDALGGDSGGPVFVPTVYAIGTELHYINTVVGIHTYTVGGNTPICNFGTLMTPEMRQFYLYNEYNTYEE